MNGEQGRCMGGAMADLHFRVFSLMGLKWHTWGEGRVWGAGGGVVSLCS